MDLPPDPVAHQRLYAWVFVSRLEAADDAARGLRDEVVDVLTQADDPFDPARRRHVGVSVLMTTPEHTDVLLCRPAGQASWRLPLGHATEQDERVEMAALRVGRALVEGGEPGPDGSGVGLGPVLCLRRERCSGEERIEHLSLCCQLVAPTVLPVLPPESVELRWFGVDDLSPSLADLSGRLAELRGSATSSERNLVSLRNTFGLRADLPWVQQVARWEADGDPRIRYAGGMARIPVVEEEALLLDRVEAAGEGLGEATALVPPDAYGGAWQDGHGFVVASTLVPDDALAARMTALLGVEVRLVQVDFPKAHLERVAAVVSADGDLRWSSSGIDVVRNRVVMTTEEPEPLLRMLVDRYPHLLDAVEVERVVLDVRRLRELLP